MPDRITASYGTSTDPSALYALYVLYVLYVLRALHAPGGKPFAAITYPLFLCPLTLQERNP